MASKVVFRYYSIKLTNFLHTKKTCRYPWYNYTKSSLKLLHYYWTRFLRFMKIWANLPQECKSKDLVFEFNCRKFQYRCSHLNLRYITCFEQRVSWLSSNCRVYIHSKHICDVIKAHSSLSVVIFLKSISIISFLV